MATSASSSPRLSHHICASLLVLAHGGAWAQTALTEDGSLRVSGFGTLGVARVSAPDGVGWRRDGTQEGVERGWSALPDSRLGAQLNYAPTPTLEFAAQAVIAHEGPAFPANQRLRWAYAAYHPTPNDSVMAGRLNTTTFGLSNYRDVGFAYYLMRPPVEFYGHLPMNLDGIAAAHQWRSDESRWRFEGYYGRERTADDAVNGALYLDPVYGVALHLEREGLSMVASYSRSRVRRNPVVAQPMLDLMDLVQQLPEPTVAQQALEMARVFRTQNVMITFSSLGLSYDDQGWVAMAEYARVAGLGNGTLRNAYASLGRRHEAFTFYGLVAASREPRVRQFTLAWDTLLTPYVGPQAAAALQQGGLAAQGAVNAFGHRQTSFGLGTRWDVHPKLALKAQWDHVRVFPGGGSLWAPARAEPVRANVLGLTADFVW